VRAEIAPKTITINKTTYFKVYFKW